MILCVENLFIIQYMYTIICFKIDRTNEIIIFSELPN